MFYNSPLVEKFALKCKTKNPFELKVTTGGKMCKHWSQTKLTGKYIFLELYNKRYLSIYLKIHSIMMQQVKQTAKLPANKIKILGQWNWTDSVPSSKSHPPFKKEDIHEKSFKFSCI